MLDVIQELKTWFQEGLDRLQKLEDRALQIDGNLHGHPSTSTVKARPSQPPVQNPPPPAPAPPVAKIGAFPGEHSSEYLALVKSACDEFGLFPDTLRAIEVWETGHFAKELDGKSTLFADTGNPGGIKRNKSLSAEYQLDPDPNHPTYCRFASWQDGVRAHAKFFTRPLYEAARAAKDSTEQATLIWKAGYSELDPGWIQGVLALIHQYQHEIPAAPEIPGQPITQRIRQAALVRVGASSKGDPGTDQGELACAYEASGILITAGVLQESERQLSVAGLVHLLESKGWRAVSQPYQDGDIPEWGPWKGGTHGHTGVFVIKNGQPWAVNNHSSTAAVACDELATYGRPLVKVLRAPGA